MSPCCCLLPDLGQPCASVYPRAAATQGGRRNHRGYGEQAAPQSLQMGAPTSQCRGSTKPLCISHYPPPHSTFPRDYSPAGKGIPHSLSCRKKIRGANPKKTPPYGTHLQQGLVPINFSRREFQSPERSRSRTPAPFAAPHRPQRGGIAASRCAAAALREVTAKNAPRPRAAPSLPPAFIKEKTNKAAQPSPQPGTLPSPVHTHRRRRKTRPEPQQSRAHRAPGARTVLPPPRGAEPRREAPQRPPVPPSTRHPPGHHSRRKPRCMHAQPPPPPRPAHLARSARGRRAHLLPKRPHTKS